MESGEFPWTTADLSARDDAPIEYVAAHPDLGWNWWNVSCRASPADVMAHPDLPLGLSFSRRLSASDVLAHPDLPWDFHVLSDNRGIATADVVRQLPHKPWEWWSISRHASMADVLANPDLPWNFFGLSLSERLEMADSDLPWVFGMLSRNPRITKADVAANPGLPWPTGCRLLMSDDVVVKLGIELDELDERAAAIAAAAAGGLGVNWAGSCSRSRAADLMSKAAFTPAAYERHRAGLVRHRVCGRASDRVDPAIVEAHPDDGWDAWGLSENDRVSLAFVLRHPAIRWDWRSLSQRLPMADVWARPDLPWDWAAVARKKQVHLTDLDRWPVEVTPEVVAAVWKEACYNGSALDVDDELAGLARREFAARRVQRWWRREVMGDPALAACRRRLAREFHRLAGDDGDVTLLHVLTCVTRDGGVRVSFKLV